MNKRVFFPHTNLITTRLRVADRTGASIENPLGRRDGFRKKENRVHVPG